MIGGAVGGPATVTIAASNAAGNPLTTSFPASSSEIEALTTPSGYSPVEHGSSRSLTEDISRPTSAATVMGTFAGALQVRRSAQSPAVDSPPGFANLPAGLAPWNDWNGLSDAAFDLVAPGIDIQLPSVAHGSLGESVIVRRESPANRDSELDAVDAVFASDFSAAFRALFPWAAIVPSNDSECLLPDSLADGDDPDSIISESIVKPWSQSAPPRQL